MEHERQQIDTMLDAYHSAAARADFEGYFNHFTEDAIFIGTDATEHWGKGSFMQYAKPHFDKGKAWAFTVLERHVFIYDSGTIAWFDELLDTRMKICRGSGVVVKHNGVWKVQHYVLSMTIPNADADSVIAIKAPIEDALMDSLSQR